MILIFLPRSTFQLFPIQIKPITTLEIARACVSTHWRTNEPQSISKVRPSKQIDGWIRAIASCQLDHSRYHSWAQLSRRGPACGKIVETSSWSFRQPTSLSYHSTNACIFVVRNFWQNIKNRRNTHTHIDCLPVFMSHSCPSSDRFARLDGRFSIAH